MQSFLVDTFLKQYVTPPTRIVLDVDASDNPLHGHQLGRFFHGYYDSYCYLPLYIFCEDHPLLALLRPSNIDTPVGLLKHLKRIVDQIRQCWPQVQIMLRGDSGFCRDYLMRWCEDHQVGYLFGLAKNQRLCRILGMEMQQAREEFNQTGQAARAFKDFIYRTHRSWSRQRRVVGKAEYLAKGENPRFVVTNLANTEYPARSLYEKDYCGRGDMENRIKEHQLFLFSYRTSCETMRANQIRMMLSTVAYIVLRALRQFGLRETELSQAQCDTIRLKLLKIGAVITVSVRRVLVSLSESYPFRHVFIQAWERLRCLVVPPPVAVSG
jgi:hypothetical protein